jgi:hypothetical protein
LFKVRVGYEVKENLQVFIGFDSVRFVGSLGFNSVTLELETLEASRLNKGIAAHHPKESAALFTHTCVSE